MKTLLVLLVLAGAVLAAPVPQCEEVSKQTTATLDKMDKVFKIRTGMLLGEMTVAKNALEGCVTHNKAVETRASLLWFLIEGFLVLLGILAWQAHRKMKRAILALNANLHKVHPDHSPKYLPSQWSFRFQLASLGACFVLTNLVALYL